MHIINLPKRYSVEQIARMLAASPVPNMSAARCAEWLLSQRGISVDQIAGSFLQARIQANNIRAMDYWIGKAVGAAWRPAPVPPVPAVENESRVSAAAHGGALEVTA